MSLDQITILGKLALWAVPSFSCMLTHMNLQTHSFTLLLVFASIGRAALIDDLDDISNFATPFGDRTSVTDDMGMASIIREFHDGDDSGIDWMPGGTTYLELATSSNVTIKPIQSIQAGSYDVNVLFFDSNDQFLLEAE